VKPKKHNSLSKVGLLIVGIPLCFQLTCMGILGWLLQAQMEEMQRHYHVRVMQENVSAMMKSALDTGLSIAKFKWKGNPEYLKQFDEQLSGAKSAMAALEEEAKPNEEEYIQRLRTDFDQLVIFAEQARKDVESESRLEAIGSSITLRKAGSKIVNALQNDVSDFESELLTDASEDPKTLIHHTIKIALLIFGAATGSLVMAFMIHKTFSSNIVDRLQILTDNTFRLARSEALHPPDKGNDEISHLDRVFHDMANALAEAARKERAVVQHALDVICSVDAEGKFMAVSPASSSVWGYAPEELIGTKLFELVTPDDLTQTNLSFKRIRDDEVDPQPFESKVMRKDGTVVHILWSAYWAPSEESMFCVAHDITERKMAENQLKASEARVRSIFESAPVALLVLDENGLVKLMNPRAERIFDYRFEELIDRHFSDLVPAVPEFDPANFTRETLEKNIGHVREMEALEHHGRCFPIEITFDHYQTTEGDRYLAAVLDVTERHEVERLKREFVSTVSHELRTPLTAIRGSLTLLAVGALGKMGDQADKAVKIAERNCLRLINLINDLLDIEKLEAGKLEMVYEEAPVAPVIDRSVEAVRAFAEQYAVRIETESVDAKLFADSDRIVQVLVNLLSNAVKYSPRDGVINVKMERRDQAVRFNVIDQGRGIPPEFIDKVFERFQQVETMDSKRKGGTGLGLAICRAIVEQHQGKIGVESELGKGSCFWFEIPVVQQKEEPAVVLSLPSVDKPTVINIAETNKVAEERS
jgi:PAS domain S-box-containing protein